MTSVTRPGARWIPPAAYLAASAITNVVLPWYQRSKHVAGKRPARRHAPRQFAWRWSQPAATRGDEVGNLIEAVPQPNVVVESIASRGCVSAHIIPDLRRHVVCQSMPLAFGDWIRSRSDLSDAACSHHRGTDGPSSRTASGRQVRALAVISVARRSRRHPPTWHPCLPST